MNKSSVKKDDTVQLTFLESYNNWILIDFQTDGNKL